MAFVVFPIGDVDAEAKVTSVALMVILRVLGMLLEWRLCSWKERS